MKVRKFSAIEGRAPEFIWGKRIPKGMMTFLVGKSKAGKSLFCAHVAAEVSQHSKVIFSMAEDDPGIMSRPRLEAAGANMDNVLEVGRFRLPENQRELEQLIVREKVALLVMDPLASHSTIPRHSDRIRRVLEPLDDLIRKTGTAVVVVDHPIKKVARDSDPMNAIGGSGSGFPAFCRMGFFFGVNPDNDEERVLAHVKGSIVPGNIPAVFFEDDLVEVPGMEWTQPALVWDTEGVMEPIRLIATKDKPGKAGRPTDKRAAAAEWLTVYLTEAEGRGEKAVKASTILEDAKHHKLSERTLRRACVDMGIVRTPPGSNKGTWELPDEIRELVAEAKESKAKGSMTTGNEVEVANVPAPEPGKGQKPQGQSGEDLISDDEIAELLEGGEE